jgi:hypothetical protein
LKTELTQLSTTIDDGMGETWPLRLIVLFLCGWKIVEKIIT